MAQPLTVVTADEPGPVDGSANAGLRAALEAGYVLAVPGDANGATTWWQVGPDGGTRAILDPSLGGLKVGPKVGPVQPPSPGGNNPNPNPGGGNPGGKPGGSRPYQVKDGFDPPAEKAPARTTQPPEAAACSGDEETMVETCPGPPTIGFVSANAAIIGGVIIAAAIVIYVVWG